MFGRWRFGGGAEVWVGKVWVDGVRDGAGRLAGGSCEVEAVRETSIVVVRGSAEGEVGEQLVRGFCSSIACSRQRSEERLAPCW